MNLPKIFFSFAILLFIILFIPKHSYAAFNGGINIGPHLEEFEQAAQLSDWVYVMIRPDQLPALISLWDKYPNTNVIIRGHIPDSQGSSLTQQYAQEWANALAALPRPVYFMPVNEPNNPAESGSGIPAQTVINYINALKTAGLFNNTNIRILSPAIDVYSMADREDYSSSSNYARQLNDLSPNFFSQFYGLALNLYGEYIDGELNVNAHDVKKGDYKQFIKDYMGITGSPRIFIVETGVKKVEDQGVRYAENRVEILKYLDVMKKLWGSDANVNMFAIFSYDPDSQHNPSASTWIYTDTEVLNAMNLNASSDQAEPTLAPPSVETDPVIDMYNITKRSNSRLLPATVQESNSQKTSSCRLGINIGGECLFGYTGALATETENFQPVYLPQLKVVNSSSPCTNLGCLFTNIIARKMSDRLTGSLNAYCPSGLNCNQKVQNNSGNSSVLAGETSKPQEVVNSYNFTMKMLLPASIGGSYADIPAIESPTPIPTSTPVPTVSVEPSIIITPISTPTPLISPPPSTDLAFLKDPSGSNTLKQLIINVANYYKVPPAIIASISWIEGNNVWNYSSQQIEDYSQENAIDPFWEENNPILRLVDIALWGAPCKTNSSLAAGPMQFTLPTWPGYKNSVRNAPGESQRNPIVCNIKDAFWATGKMNKERSGTAGSTAMNWDKKAVGKAGKAYYGVCGNCPGTTGDPELNTNKNYDKFACNRFSSITPGGMSYCEYMWLYYQCNENSSSSDQFYQCIGGKRP